MLAMKIVRRDLPIGGNEDFAHRQLVRDTLTEDELGDSTLANAGTVRKRLLGQSFATQPFAKFHRANPL